MNEVDSLKKIVRDQARMLQEKNRLLSDLEYRLKQNIVTDSRKEDLAKFQFQLSRQTIDGQAGLLKTILGSIPSGLMVLDAEKRIISYNPAVQNILEIQDKEILGKPCSRFFGESCEMHCLLEKAMETGEAQCSREVRVRTGNGREIVLALDVAPIRDSHGNLIGGVEIFSDITGDVIRESQLQKKQDSLIHVLAKIMEKKDHYILSHSERVKDLALSVAFEAGISEEKDQQELTYASLLHDIGLISVPDEVLLAKRTGTGKPVDLIQAHPADGEWMLSNVEGFEEIKKIVRSHHERFDGKGYPDGIKGDHIPLASRIITLAEAYDAMLHDTATKQRSKEEVLEEIKANRGSQFDPGLVDIFVSKVKG
ncbi:MAG: HD domain-containing phosphohydrolase [bacterium]